jgi:hypothetical protein
MLEGLKEPLPKLHERGEGKEDQLTLKSRKLSQRHQYISINATGEEPPKDDCSLITFRVSKIALRTIMKQNPKEGINICGGGTCGMVTGMSEEQRKKMLRHRR